MVRLLICEPTSRWTAELERSFSVSGDRQCRWQPFFPEFLFECRQGNAHLAVLVTTADDAGLAQLAELCGAVPPELRVVCLVAENHSQWEWAARDLGAEIVLPDVSEPNRVVRAIDRLITYHGPDA